MKGQAALVARWEYWTICYNWIVGTVSERSRCEEEQSFWVDASGLIMVNSGVFANRPKAALKILFNVPNALKKIGDILQSVYCIVSFFQRF